MENKLHKKSAAEEILHTAAVAPSEFLFDFARLPVLAKASDASLMGDAGILPLRHLDFRAGWSKDFARCFTNPKLATMRQPLDCVLLQRILGVCAGWEDANDHDDLRLSAGWQIAVKGEESLLASQPTISRVENSAEWGDYERMGEFLAKIGAQQVARAWRAKVPQELLLDLDSTDDPTHGKQQFSLFHAYYEQTQHQVLCVSEPVSKSILSAWLLPGTAAPFKSAMRDLARVQAQFPGVRLHIRGDSGFANGELMGQLDEAKMGYTMRLARNDALLRHAELNAQLVQDYKKLTGESETIYGMVQHQAGTWESPRTVLYRCEAGDAQASVHFLVTTREMKEYADIQREFETYGKRGSFEHRFDELKNDFSMDRLSCSRWRGNMVRVVLHVVAYGLMNMLRLLEGIPQWLKIARAKTWTQKIFKAAAHIVVSTRRVMVNFDKSWPSWIDFTRVCNAALAFG